MPPELAKLDVAEINFGFEIVAPKAVEEDEESKNEDEDQDAEGESSAMK